MVRHDDRQTQIRQTGASFPFMCLTPGLASGVVGGPEPPTQCWAEDPPEAAACL